MKRLILISLVLAGCGSKEVRDDSGMYCARACKADNGKFSIGMLYDGGVNYKCVCQDVKKDEPKKEVKK